MAMSTPVRGLDHRHDPRIHGRLPLAGKQHALDADPGEVLGHRHQNFFGQKPGLVLEKIHVTEIAALVAAARRAHLHVDGRDPLALLPPIDSWEVVHQLGSIEE
jgi:hypothetical protein